MRAAKMEAGTILKGTHSGVDGVYSADPRREADATATRRSGSWRSCPGTFV